MNGSDFVRPGLIAHEVAEAGAPYCVTGEKDAAWETDDIYENPITEVVDVLDADGNVVGQEEKVVRVEQVVAHKKGDPIMQTIAETPLIPSLLAAIQDLYRINDELRARVATLEAK